MVIAERSMAGESQTSSFEASEELLRARNAAEGDDRARDLRDLHVALQSPNWSGPAPVAKFLFEIAIICRDSENVCPFRRMQRLTQVPGWE